MTEKEKMLAGILYDANNDKTCSKKECCARTYALSTTM